MDPIAKIAEDLTTARTKLATLEARADSARRSSEAATPGGLTGYDSAVLSGIRRKPNHKDDRRRFNAYTREAETWQELENARKRVETLTARLERAKRDAAAPRDLDGVKPGDLVRDSTGWHRVVRVSAKSVSVETGYSWTDRIPKDKIIETREVVAA